MSDDDRDLAADEANVDAALTFLEIASDYLKTGPGLRAAADILLSRSGFAGDPEAAREWLTTYRQDRSDAELLREVSPSEDAVESAREMGIQPEVIREVFGPMDGIWTTMGNEVPVSLPGYVPGPPSSPVEVVSVDRKTGTVTVRGKR